MNIYTFEKESGNRITAFNSDFVMTRIARTESATHVGMVFLEPGETIGFHEAVVPQLLLLIEGEGWVRSDTHQKRLLKKGEAVSWTKGEGHETTTENGLTALVIEAEDLGLNDFNRYMKI